MAVGLPRGMTLIHAEKGDLAVDRQALRRSPAPARAACSRRTRAAEGSALYNASKAMCPCCGAFGGYPARNHPMALFSIPEQTVGILILIFDAPYKLVFRFLSRRFAVREKPSHGGESVYVRRIDGVRDELAVPQMGDIPHLFALSTGTTLPECRSGVPYCNSQAYEIRQSHRQGGRQVPWR
jgi:hypothetical protein